MNPTQPVSLLPSHLGMAMTRSGPMMFFKRDEYIGRSLELYGDYCLVEAEFLDQILFPGNVVVEAGANIGAHTVGMARKVGPGGRIIAFEPQRAVFQLLCANLALNGLENVDARPAGVGRVPGKAYMSAVDYVHANGNFGGVALHDSGAIEVPVQTVDSLELSELHLLKIDVEGMELEVLQGAAQTIARCRPCLYLENDRRDKSEAIIRLVQSHQYQTWWHCPSLFSPRNFHGVQNNVFPHVASVNMLALPAEKKIQVVDMIPATLEQPHGLDVINALKR